MPPDMRSMLGCTGAPARMMGDQRVLHHHQSSPGLAAAAASAGLLSRAAYRLAGFGGLLDARGRAQLAALAGFGVVVGGSPINHRHQHPQYRPSHSHQLAPLQYGAAHCQFLPPAPVFTPADLHLVLYGYARSRSDDEERNATPGAHSLSGLRINELSYGMLSSDLPDCVALCCLVSKARKNSKMAAFRRTEARGFRPAASLLIPWVVFLRFWTSFSV